MSKPKIKIIDTQFAHTPNASFGCGDLLTPCTAFDWDRSGEKSRGRYCGVNRNEFPVSFDAVGKNKSRFDSGKPTAGPVCVSKN